MIQSSRFHMSSIRFSEAQTMSSTHQNLLLSIVLSLIVVGVTACGGDLRSTPLPSAPPHLSSPSPQESPSIIEQSVQPTADAIEPMSEIDSDSPELSASLDVSDAYPAPNESAYPAPVENSAPTQGSSQTTQSLAVAIDSNLWTTGQLLFHSNAQNQVYEVYVANQGGIKSLTRAFLPSVEAIASPDGATIAFTVYPDPDSTKIFLMDADGSNKRIITDGLDSSYDWRPTWSPDGRQILFVSNHTGHIDVFKVNIDGTEVVNLTNSPSNDLDPHWSPVANRIVFASDRGDGIRRLYLMDPDGANVKLLDGVECKGMCAFPRWSPAGKEVVYASDADGSWDIYVVDADGSDNRLVTTRTGNNYMASWISDEEIVFAGEEDFTYGTDIFVINKDGTSLRRLVGAEYTDEGHPNWLPFFD